MGRIKSLSHTVRPIGSFFLGEDFHQIAVLHFRYFPSVRADEICVSCHKHHGDVFCAVFFITSIVINGSLGPLRQQD